MTIFLDRAVGLLSKQDILKTQRTQKPKGINYTLGFLYFYNSNHSQNIIISLYIIY